MEGKPKKFSISFLKGDEAKNNNPVGAPDTTGTLGKGVPQPSGSDGPVYRTRSKDITGSQAEQPEREGKGDKKPEEEEAWAQVGLVIRIQELTLSNGLYNGMTGIIKSVVGPGNYGADVQVTNGDILRLDQDNMRTVLPSPGDFGLIVRGAYRDTKVRVISLGKEDIEVELEEGRRTGHRLLIPSDYVSRHIAIRPRD